MRAPAFFTFFVVGVAGCSFTSSDVIEEVLPEVSFAADQSITDESIGTAEILLQLSEPTSQTVTVDFSILGGTATLGNDIRIASGKVTFAPHTTRAAARIDIVDDGIEEPEENTQIVLGEPAHAVLGAVTTHDLRISAFKLPRVRFVTQASSADEGAGAQRFAVELDKPSATEVVVQYQWTGTAESADHGVVNGMLTIPAGRVSTFLDAPITNDPTDEDDETIDVAMIARTGAVVAPGQGAHVHTIADDDPPPTIGFASTASSAGEASTTAQLDVVLSLASEKQITIDYAAVAGGTASPDDFTLTPGTLTFPPGTARLQIPVGIVNDAVAEPSETVTIGLSNATNAILPTAATAYALTIIDDDPPAAPPP